MKRFVTFYIVLFCTAGTGHLQAEDNLVEQGRKVFDHWCQPCHGDGPNYPGTIALRAKYDSDIEAVLAKRKGMTPEFIELYVRNGISVMPFFRKTEISDEELKALAAYLTR